MSKEKLHTLITRELSRLNAQIDEKIVRGRSYNKEARRHRALMSQMRQLKNDALWHGFFNRLMH